MGLDWNEQIQEQMHHGLEMERLLDFLVPRLDIGLLHANITQRMCDAWMSTIVHTLCERSGMSTVHSMNRKAFCYLSGIPDLWMRLQTARITDLLVSLNTKNCQSGRSTVNRFCALLKSTNLDQATAKLLTKKRFAQNENFRMVSTLRYLKTIDIAIIERVLQQIN